MRKLDELQLWLEGEKPEQVNWRVDPKNLPQVSEFVTQYGQTVGGKSPSVVWSKIQREREIAAQIIEAADREQKQREKIVEAVKADYIASGGTEKAFNSRLGEIVDAYAIAGRTKEVMEKLEKYRRSQAARTF